MNPGNIFTKTARKRCFKALVTLKMLYVQHCARVEQERGESAEMFGDHGVPAQNNPAHGIQPGRPGIPLRITPTFILNPIQKFCGILFRKFHTRRNVVQNFALLYLINFPFFTTFYDCSKLLRKI